MGQQHDKVQAEENIEYIKCDAVFSDVISAVIMPIFKFYMSLKCGHTINDFPDRCVRICSGCCASLCRCDLLVISLKLMFRIVFFFYTRSAKFVDTHLFQSPTYFSLAAKNFPRSLRSQISQISLSSLVPLALPDSPFICSSVFFLSLFLWV